ncbi:hypothetical protein D3C80_1007110 [compost metagenome]
MLLLAGAVPGFTQLAAATHVGDGKGHAAFEQAQAGVGKPRVEAFAVGAVTVQVQRHRLANVGAALHQADRHLGAIGGGGPQALADVGIRVERAEHRGFLEHLLGAVGQLQLAHLGRAVERLVTQADTRADELQAVLHVQAVGGVRQLHAVGRQALRVHLDDRQAAFAQAQAQGAGVEGQALEHHRVAMGHQQLPLLAGGHYVGNSLVQGEVDAVLVAADKPAPLAFELAVVRVVLVTLDPGRQAGKGLLGVFGIEHPGFAGGLAVEQQDQLALGAGAIAVQEEAAIGFFMDRVDHAAAQAVAQQFMRTVGVVQFGEEQRLVVVGPGHAAVAVLERQLLDGAVGQLLDVQGVDLVARGVQAVGQALVVGADAECAQRQKATLGQLIRVEQQLFAAFINRVGIIGRARAAVMAGVFVTGRGARVVQVRAPGRGQ